MSAAKIGAEAGAGEARFRNLVENAFDIIVECAASGRILYASPNVRDVLGYDESEITGTFLSDLLHPEDVETGLSAFFEGLTKGSKIHATLRYRHRNGEWRSIEGRGQSYRTASGKVRVGIIGRDVTDRVLTEERLKRTQRRLELQLQQLPVAIIGWDLEWQVTEWNPAAERLFGYSKDEAGGMAASVLIPPATSETEAAASMARVRAFLASAANPIRISTQNRTKSGATLACEWTLVPVLDDTGTMTGILTIVQDVSDRHRARRLEEFAYQDTVTGMPNRRLFDDRLAESVEAGRRKGDSFAVLYLDLDDFKAVNDRHGHHIGDAVLAAVGLRLRICVRDGDTVARVGGDEFGILLAHLESPNYADEVATRIVASLRRPLVADEMTFSVAASVGIAVFPADARDATNLLRKADAAMYRAKEKGKSTFSR